MTAPIVTIACHRCREHRDTIAELRQQLASAEAQTDAVLEITAQVANEALRNPGRRAELLLLMAQTADEAATRRKARR